VALFGGCAATGAVSGPSSAPSERGSQAVARLVSESVAARSQASSMWSARFLAATPELPRIGRRRLYHSADGSRYYSEREIAVLPPDARANFQSETVDEDDYYDGPLGTPLFYIRLLDLVSENLRAPLPGRRILEWNYTSIVPLRLLAAQGVDAVGVSPSPRLRALYSEPGDQGAVPMRERELTGHVTVRVGRFPIDEPQGGYDVIIARNVLTRGFARPGATATAAPGDPNSSDEEFLRRLYATLRPGGRLLAYNLCPAPPPADQNYDPSRDCRNPFPQALWQAMGFRVRDYDRSDTPAARALAAALAPGPLPAGLRADELLATYTLVERP
jgi:hypothetical protein